MNKTVLSLLIASLLTLTSVADAKVGSGSKASKSTNTASKSMGLTRSNTIAKIDSRNYKKPEAPKVAPPVVAQSKPQFSVSTAKPTVIATAPQARADTTLSQPPVYKSKTPTYSNNHSSGMDIGTAIIAAEVIDEIGDNMEKNKTPRVTPQESTSVTTPIPVTKTTVPNPQASQKSGSGFFWFMFAIAMGLMAVMCYVLYQKNKVKKVPRMNTTPEPVYDPTIEVQQTVRTGNEEQILRDKGEAFYVDFQKAVESKDFTYIQQHSTREFFELLQNDIQHYSDATTIQKIEVEDVYDIRMQQGVFYATVHFVGHFIYNDNPYAPEVIDEAWHLLRDEQGVWKVAGINSIA